MPATLNTPEVNEHRTTVPDVSTDFDTKYLTFSLADEDYGLKVLTVREIIGIMDITRVPQTPNFVRGVVNLRGKVIPVLDLREKLGLPAMEYNTLTCIIVVDIGVLMGVIVDTVQEVHHIPEADIEESPKLCASVDTTFILGMGKVNGKVKILLDVERILTSEELVQFQEMTDR